MPLGETHIFQVVVLAARAHTLLRSRGPRVVALLEAQKDVLELVHPRIGEQQRGIAMRHQRRTLHPPVPLAFEKLQELFAYFVATQFVFAVRSQVRLNPASIPNTRLSQSR